MSELENNLTENEKIILSLLNQDYDSKEIAKEMHLSVHTIRSYIKKFEILKLI